MPACSSTGRCRCESGAILERQYERRIARIPVRGDVVRVNGCHPDERPGGTLGTRYRRSGWVSQAVSLRVDENVIHSRRAPNSPVRLNTNGLHLGKLLVELTAPFARVSSMGACTSQARQRAVSAEGSESASQSIPLEPLAQVDSSKTMKPPSGENAG